MDRDTLLQWLHDFLEVDRFPDMGVNGLQVEGKKEIKTIMTGVSATRDLIRKAMEKGVEMLLVHHGILWDKQDPVIRGPHKERLALLLSQEINLVAYHLPLDAHKEVGNNAQLAQRLGFPMVEPAFPYKGSPPIGFVVDGAGIPVEAFKARCLEVLGEPLIHIPGGPKTLHRIGIVSGGGQGECWEAIQKGCDAFLTGEISEYVVALAHEGNLHYFAGGHYRTEQFGIKALGERISQTYNLKVIHDDSPHPY